MFLCLPLHIFDVCDQDREIVLKPSCAVCVIKTAVVLGLGWYKELIVTTLAMKSLQEYTSKRRCSSLYF